MKRRTRPRWRRTAAAARWGLTLLLVALVGVTVASGWWQIFWLRPVPREGGASSLVLVADVRGGSFIWRSMPRQVLYADLVEQARFEVRRRERSVRLLIFGEQFPFKPDPDAFNWWRAATTLDGWCIALTYPTLAVALPALFLWYRRLFRRYGRGHCQRCGYDLAGLAVTDERITCPECGTSAAAARIRKRGLPGDPSPGARSAASD